MAETSSTADDRPQTEGGDRTRVPREPEELETLEEIEADAAETIDDTQELDEVDEALEEAWEEGDEIEPLEEAEPARELEISLDPLLHFGAGPDAESEEDEQRAQLRVRLVNDLARDAQPDEFLCISCFLLKKRTQLADAQHMRCRDCVDPH
jgi:hypothetical protein